MLFPENLKSVEIQTREDGDDYLVGILEDDENKEEKQGYKIQKATKKTNGLRFVEKEEYDTTGKKQTIKFFLVEDDEYLEKKLKNEDYDFSNHIFLININFRNIKFTKKAEFKKSIFVEKADFKETAFNEEVYFRETIFIEEVNFLLTIFTKKVDFKIVIFSKEIDFRAVKFRGIADFLNVTFIKEANFRDAEFIKEVDYRKSIFVEKADFRGVEFNEKAKFSGATFTGEADFERATFKKKVIFLSTTFTKEARFSEATFTKEAIFFKATFTKKAKFTGATFIGEADFRLVTFTGDAGFSFINILESSSFDFRRAIFDNKFILNLSPDEEETEDKKFSVLFEDVFIEAKNFLFTSEIIEYLSDESDRYIFLNMKNGALARQDNITALELHKREYDTHYRYLKKHKKDNLLDFLLLWFEKGVSGFGTDILKSFSWFIASYAFFSLGIFYIALCNGYFWESRDVIYFSSSALGFVKTTNVIDWNSAIMYTIKPFKDYFADIESMSTFWFIITIALRVLRTLFVGILAYEVIKSFRKFSRKL